MTKVALVTGASSGMGESTAILLVNKGTRCTEQHAVQTK